MWVICISSVVKATLSYITVVKGVRAFTRFKRNASFCHSNESMLHFLRWSQFIGTEKTETQLLILQVCTALLENQLQKRQAYKKMIYLRLSCLSPYDEFWFHCINQSFKEFFCILGPRVNYIK